MADWSDKCRMEALTALLSGVHIKSPVVTELKDRSIVIAHFTHGGVGKPGVMYSFAVDPPRWPRWIQGAHIQSIRYTGDPADVTKHLLYLISNNYQQIISAPYHILVDTARCIRVLTKDLEVVLPYYKDYCKDYSRA